jgi:hypothetical protein
MRDLSAVVLMLLFTSMPAAAALAPKEVDLQATGTKRLATEQIRALRSGRTVHHVNLVSGFRVAIWYSTNGTRSFGEASGGVSRFADLDLHPRLAQSRGERLA